MEIYKIEKNRLIIFDEKMKIDINEDFSIPSVEKPKKEVFFKKDGKIFFQKNGKLHGETILYENKKKISSSFYYMGKLHGPSIFYSKKGDILSETFFVHGKRWGKCRRYYLSKKLYSIEGYIDDSMHGKQEYFYENGECKSSLFYDMDILKKGKLYFEDGSLKREIDKNLDKIYERNV